MNEVKDIYPLYPNLTRTIKLTGFRFNIFDYKPFESCQIGVQLCKEDGIGYETKIFVLDKTNGFLEWSDDQFIVNFIKNKLQEDK